MAIEVAVHEGKVLVVEDLAIAEAADLEHIGVHHLVLDAIRHLDILG